MSKRAVVSTSLGALGVVYGDIGTSPLYAIKECLAWHPDGAFSPHAVEPHLANTLGVLSLMFWSLVLVICVKYVLFVLRADNKGEGGILALAALVTGSEGTRLGRYLAIPLLLGLFGTGLLFGDGVITPAISVLGAMEGLSEQSPRLTDFVVPVTVAILVGLFMVQRFGTGRIGFAFGPIILVWFLAIGAIGLRWILVDPRVLAAVNPVHGAEFLSANGYQGFMIVGLVFLVVTGGEALYADMGHFGRAPIRLAWFTVALPGLLLNYFGQGALMISSPPGTIRNPFYSAAEQLHVGGVSLLIPMLVLSLMAAIIASQALISGVFSITRQAMQLGFWPRLTVVHTSPEMEGQVYIPEMNWLLMAGTIAVVLQFGSSSGLAAAYGIAVTGTMAITSVLFYLVCRRRWGFSAPRALAFLVPFLVIDLAFFSANAVKILAGGWFPLAIGAAVFAIMTTWWRGRLELARIMESGAVPTALFLADLEVNPLPRVEGTAVFMSSSADSVPNVVLHHVKHNRVLHGEVVLCSVVTEPVPWVTSERSVEVTPLGQNMFRVVARCGFMQTPNVPDLVARAAARGDFQAQPMTTTYYLGRQTLLVSGKSKMARWRKMIFAFLSHNARPPTSFFQLPPNRVVELGLQIEI
ncbi:MAG: potassium transporter Kup [Kofleriaceae bacterium]|nr:MAG: potassium transporter Kup [Kofleriaceae bacterium]MBZ0234902.1 potassium transporter Kup [Kofleriaceae bacterium]